MRPTIALIALLVPCCKGDDAPATTTNVASHAELAAALLPELTTPDAESLIPEAAPIVGRVDVKALLASELYKVNGPLVERQAGTALETMKGCSIGLEKLGQITFGFDAIAEDVVIVVDADGIGKSATIECLHAALKEKQGQAPWTTQERAGETVLAMADTESFAYVLGDDRIVLVSKEWADAMDTLVDGKGTSAFASKLAPAIARADKKHAVWIAGTLPAEILRATVVEGAKDFAVSADVTGGAAFSASFGYASADEANAKRAHVQQEFDGIKDLAPSMGVPQAIIDSVKIGANETALLIGLRASVADLQALQEAIGKVMRGL